MAEPKALVLVVIKVDKLLEVPYSNQPVAEKLFGFIEPFNVAEVLVTLVGF